MSIRALPSALALLLLATPLAASLCGGCAGEHCPPAETIAETALAPAEQKANGHCHEVVGHELTGTTVAHGVAGETAMAEAGTAAADCCLTAPATEPESRALAPAAASFSFILEPAPGVATSTASQAAPELRRKPPLPAPEPLYTLHASLLI